jgi:hypothetical protein
MLNQCFIQLGMYFSNLLFFLKCLNAFWVVQLSWNLVGKRTKIEKRNLHHTSKSRFLFHCIL